MSNFRKLNGVREFTGLGSPQEFAARHSKHETADGESHGLTSIPADDSRSACAGRRIAIDLESRTLVLPDGRKVSFPIDSFARHCLMNGIDELGFLIGNEAEISRYEQRAS